MASTWDNAVGRLTDMLKVHVGDVVEVEGRAMVPVSLVAAGFGGGTGRPKASSSSEEPAELTGSGGGGIAIPLGVYTVVDGTVKFQPNPVVMAGVLLPLVGATGCAIRGVIRAAKRKR